MSENEKKPETRVDWKAIVASAVSDFPVGLLLMVLDKVL